MNWGLTIMTFLILTSSLLNAEVELKSGELSADTYRSSQRDSEKLVSRWENRCQILHGKAKAHVVPSFDGAFRIYGGAARDYGTLLVGGFLSRNNSWRIRKYGYSFSVDAPPADCVWEEGERTTATLALHPGGAIATYACISPKRGRHSLPVALEGDHGRVHLTWKVNHGHKHVYGVTVCAAPIYNMKSDVDLRTWVSMNLKKHIDRFALYVRSELYDKVAHALHWYIESRIVILHDAGPSPPALNVTSFESKREFDEADRALHAQYEDQVLLLANCHHTYGYNSRWILSLDIDEIVIGDALYIEQGLNNTSGPLLLPTVAYGAPPLRDSSCTDRDVNIPFTRIFTYRQNHSIPRKEAWPRTKMMAPPRTTSLYWMHQLAHESDSCAVCTHATEASLRIAHYVELNADSYIQGGKCRCGSLHKTLPCNVEDKSIAVLLHQQSPLPVNMRFLSYVETGGLNNQLVALENACYLALYTDRILVVSEWVLHHIEALLAPQHRLHLCDLINCDIFGSQCPYIWRSSFDGLMALPTRTCRTVDCIRSSMSTEVLHLRDKTIFHVGYKSTWFKNIRRNVTSDNNNDTDPIVPSGKVKHAATSMYKNYKASLNDNPCVLVVHVRYTPRSDYEFGDAHKRRLDLWRATVDALEQMPHNTAVVLMSNNCSSPAVIAYKNTFTQLEYSNTTCLLEGTKHPMLEVFEQMWFAQFADGFASDSKSTVSLRVMSWRKNVPVRNSCGASKSDGSSGSTSTLFSRDFSKLRQNPPRPASKQENTRDGYQASEEIPSTRQGNAVEEASVCGVASALCDDVIASGHSCGKRVSYLKHVRSMTARKACARVADEFPQVCGECKV